LEHFFHDLFSRLEVLRQKKTRGSERVADVVQLLHHFVAGKVRGRVEQGHVQPQEVADRVDILPSIEPAQHRPPTGARKPRLALGDEPRELRYLLANLRGMRVPLGLLRRHVAEIQHVDHFLQLVQRIR